MSCLEGRTALTNYCIRIGVPNGIRTRVLALKGLDPRPLDDGDAAGAHLVR